MSGYRYWRVYCTANNGGTYLDMVSLQMRASPGGPNLCIGGTAIASGYLNATYVPANAFDGNPATAYADTGSRPSWIGYILPVAAVVVEIAVQGYVNGPSDCLKDFSVDYSDDDGITWTPVTSFTGQTGWTTAERTFAVYVGTLSGGITESLAITDWRVDAIRASSGTFAGTGTATGNTYAIATNTLEPCIIVLHPVVDGPWSANEVQTVGRHIVPKNPDATPHLFKVTAITGDAKFGAIEPTYNLSGTTTSGNVTLTYVAPLIDPVALGPKIPVAT